MRRLLNLFLVLMTLGFSSAYAADNPNILVMGEDSDEGTIPRDSRVFKRVVGALVNQMHDNSFNVYEETAVTLDDFSQGRVRRDDGELIDIGRSIKRPPIDIVVIFSIYTRALDRGNTSKIKLRIEGRLLNVKTGKRLGNFEVVSGQVLNAPTKCSRDCILEIVGDKSRVLANDLGAVLAEKLAWMVDGGAETGQHRSATNDLITEYTLVFDDFSAEDFSEIEEYLVLFSGYHSHRPIELRRTRSEIWYQSSIGSAKLNRNIQKMLAELDLRGLINFEGNTYTVNAITLRGKTKKPVQNDDW
ncbi:hypothetical protein QX776_03215 [Alteromonadaceae bacterium BrNp21-10]|nr:hypothetical protein [Alteromonadaceae bacterium BrNp21-10]